ncbi:hypothetical protein BH10ACT11_BH10ACT11_11320 [soil metagenome]
MASRVYVIELAPAAGKRRDPRIPWVYVGSSARDADLRFAQHQRGYRSSGIVKRFAVRLRPDLYDDLPAFKGSKLALGAELERARELAACGFVAHSDGTSYGWGEGYWEKWDAARLEQVGEHVDAAVAEMCECAFESLDAATCSRLLCGERGFWTQRFIDSGDPPPCFGRFSHVEAGALSRRVADCFVAA